METIPSHLLSSEILKNIDPCELWTVCRKIWKEESEYAFRQKLIGTGMELKIVNFPNYRWHGSEYLQMICTEFKNNILTFIPVEKEYFNHDPMFGPVIIRCSPCIWDTYAFEIVETECATEIFLDVENDFISSDFGGITCKYRLKKNKDSYDFRIRSVKIHFDTFVMGNERWKIIMAWQPPVSEAPKNKNKSKKRVKNGSVKNV